MKINQEKVGDVLILRVDETRLDSTVAPQFKTALLGLLEDKQTKKVLIDLKKVDYVDSSGLGALLFGHRQLKSNSGKLKLVHLSTKIRTLIKIAKLDDVLEGFTSEKEALKSF